MEDLKDEWMPVVALPNLDMAGKLLSEYAVIVPSEHPLVEDLCKVHPPFMKFRSKFRGQFGEQIFPSFLLLRTDAPESFRTAEAITGLRDVLALSVVPYARAKRLKYGKASNLVFTTPFQFYPWMLDKHYEDMFAINSAMMALHVLGKFQGQTFPEQSQARILDLDIDMPLANALLNRWVDRFKTTQHTWENKKLFRSLNMANEAARMPAMTATTFYDVGRSLALWVSAYEILAHPGKGQADFEGVSSKLEKVQWLKAELKKEGYEIPVRKKPQNRKLSSWVLKNIYNLRNAFLHGNEVEDTALQINGKPAIDFAACLFRLVLTDFLQLYAPPLQQGNSSTEAVVNQIEVFSKFKPYQRAFEDALMTAIP